MAGSLAERIIAVMTARELVWGVLAWPAVAVVHLLLGAGGWDLEIGSAVMIVTATAAAYTLVGVLLWLPAGRWLDQRVGRRLPGIGRAAAFLVVGLVIGAVVSSVLVAVFASATWPSSARFIVEQAAMTGVASLAGWLLAWRIERRAGTRPRHGEALPASAGGTSRSAVAAPATLSERSHTRLTLLALVTGGVFAAIVFAALIMWPD